MQYACHYLRTQHKFSFNLCDMKFMRYELMHYENFNCSVVAGVAYR